MEKTSRGVSRGLMRNFALAAIYMIHLKDGKLSISSDRLENLRSFGNWVSCNCHQYTGADQHCGNEWNFANNNWGLHRSHFGHQPCLVVVRSRKMQRKFVTHERQESALKNDSEKKIADQVVRDCFKVWVQYKDGLADM